jgi:hypothetical protein
MQNEGPFSLGELRGKEDLSVVGDTGFYYRHKQKENVFFKSRADNDYVKIECHVKLR